MQDSDEGAYQVVWCDWGIVRGGVRRKAGEVGCGQISKGLDHQIKECRLFLVVNMEEQVFSYVTKKDIKSYKDM